MPLTVAIVGMGPTGLYTLRELIQHPTPLEIWVFERRLRAGHGMPYGPQTTSPLMLANSRVGEVPAVLTPYLTWLRQQPGAWLRLYGLEPEHLDDRLVTPRLMVGAYLAAQFREMLTLAARHGHLVQVREQTTVLDIREQDGRLRVVTDTAHVPRDFDRVVLASGHVFEDRPETMQRFASPWEGLARAHVPACRVGILGTSLSAIDATLRIVSRHGSFVEEGERLRYVPSTDGLSFIWMSRHGLMPEVDFHVPARPRPLIVMTDAALSVALANPKPLDAVHALFQRELLLADPDYAARIGLDDLNADTFADAYFAERLAHDPFVWARRNLAECEQNERDRVTVGWRYAILRMHEKVERVLAVLGAEDRARFAQGMQRVFVDNYAAVPALSMRRVLAMHDAGILQIRALGDDYTITGGPTQTTVTIDGRPETFDVFVDARGQQPRVSQDLPWPSVRRALLMAEETVPLVDANYLLRGRHLYAGRMFLAALPYLMHARPFVQGLTCSAELGTLIGKELRQHARALPNRKRSSPWQAARPGRVRDIS